VFDVFSEVFDVSSEVFDDFGAFGGFFLLSRGGAPVPVSG
jgi:hypothetical protein